MPENRADTFLRMILRARHGRLKIYLGYCAGVGKTWQMLEEAHRLVKAGIDVVVGLVETHGRSETAALLEGLEIVPRRLHDYRGITVEEMDVDAILARRPQVVLVDELAHTNVPGSRNAKRFEDVEDILSAGIHVISTLNLQHIESLYDTVERITGIKVHERLPDGVVADADEIVNVDLTTEDLTKRLEEGKVYPKERVGTALSHFFRKPNLEQLRELTLREIASQIDLHSRDGLDHEISATPDQVMVCLSSRGPNSERLLRYASRLAGRLNRNWYAVYVQTPGEEPALIDSHTHRILSGTLILAKQLGAMVFTHKGEDIADTILQFAGEYRVGHIVIGSPGRMSLWKRLTGKKDVVSRLIRMARGITVVVVDTRRYEPCSESCPAGDQETASTGPVAAEPLVPPLSLRSLLSAQRIIIWDEPVEKEEVLRRLVDAVGRDGGIRDVEEVVETVLESERTGSTFFNEGAAFPHLRIKGLSEPQIALGLTHQGVSDVSIDNPIECVFLVLTGAEVPDQQLEALSVVSRAAQSRHLITNLEGARTPKEAMKHIREWEAFGGDAV